METQRSCAWMAPPETEEIKISAARWWIAVSRDVLGKAYRQNRAQVRPSVQCQRTPTFVSPLGARKL